MNFFKVLSFLFACIVALTTTVSAAPSPDFWKDLERAGQNVRDAIIKAKPAVDVVGEAVSIYKGANRSDEDD